MLAGLGGWLLTTDFAERDATRVAELPQVLPEKFQGVVLGQSVMLEGMLASSEPVGPQGFVVYRREQFTGLEESGASKGRQMLVGSTLLGLAAARVSAQALANPGPVSHACCDLNCRCVHR